MLFSKYKKKKVLHFLHIGKTGGIALKTVFQENSDSCNYSIKLHGHGIRLTDIPVGEKVIFFLRDPVSRFMSGFYSRQRKGRPRCDSEWSKVEEDVFGVFNTPNELALALSDETSFHYDLAVKAMNNIDHLKSYYMWLKDDEYLKSRRNDVLFIGFQESLDSDFEKLKMIIGLPMKSTLPKDDIGAHRNPANLDKYLNDDAMCVLNKWYAPDIKLIDTCKYIMLNKSAGQSLLRRFFNRFYIKLSRDR